MRFFILTILILALSACETKKEEKGPKDDDIVSIDAPHADYRPSDHFITSRGFKYDEINEMGFEDIKRGERELSNHRPEIEVTDQGHKIILKFDSHPHSKKHFWSWIEIVDYDGQVVYENVPAPEEDSETFEYTIFSEVPFKKRIRIRCYCQVHGEFIDYLNLPLFEKKTILDRQSPQD